MRITPLDVRKQEFKKVMRGLDAEEVTAFLATVADEYEAVLLDNKQLRERILELDEKIQEYRHMEKTLRDTLMTAERVLSEAKDNARKEADLILKDAEIKAQQSVEGHRRSIAELRREVVELHKEKEAFLARFKGLAEAQIQFIENHRTDFEELDRHLLGQAAPRGAPAARPAPEPDQNGAARAERGATERDVWRDYKPGRPASGAAVERPATPVRETAGADAATAAAPSAAPRTEAWDDTPDPYPDDKPPRPTGPIAVGRHGADLRAEDVDQLLSPLRAMQEEPAAPAHAPAQPPPARDKEGDGVWNMENFTRGLSDL